MGYLRMIGASQGGVAGDECSRFVIVGVPIMAVVWLCISCCMFFYFKNKVAALLFSLAIPFAFAALVVGMTIGLLCALLLLPIKGLSMLCCKGLSEKIDPAIVSKGVLNGFVSGFTWMAEKCNDTDTCACCGCGTGCSSGSPRSNKVQSVPADQTPNGESASIPVRIRAYEPAEDSTRQTLSSHASTATSRSAGEEAVNPVMSSSASPSAPAPDADPQPAQAADVAASGGADPTSS